MANKVIVVGFPRSGTSWVMQTLFLLKFPVFGIPFPPNRDPLMQPDGKPFWEFPQILAGDLSILGVSQCGVKVLLRAAIENIVLDPTDKVIWCRRDPAIIAQAVTDWNLGSSSYSRNLKVISQWNDRFLSWVGSTPYLQGNIDWAVDHKVAAITAIRDFIGSTQDITDAVENII